MGAPIRSYRDLRVYQQAFDVGMALFHASKAFPSDERYVLSSQIRRSSRSVCANISEAWRKRRYPAAFVAKLSDAETEACETQVWLEFATACGYMEASESSTLCKRVDGILGQLVKMAESPEKWVR